MATHPLGTGTCNLSINVRKSLHAALGRAAFRTDISMGEFCRRLFAAAGHFVHLIKAAEAAAAADRRALQKLRSAQRPHSPGGIAITQEEATAIEREIEASEELDQQIAAARPLEGLA